MKNLNLNDSSEILRKLADIENMAGLPAVDLNQREDIRVNIRVNETIGAGKFKPDPLIPGGFIANSLTIRAMRPDIFVVGESVEDLSVDYECACGENFDLQFWKICPYCARAIKA